MIAVRSAASAGVMTRPRSGAFVGGPPVSFTAWGVGSVPPFTMALYAVASWMSVTAIPWPNEPLARSICWYGWTAGSRTRAETPPAPVVPGWGAKPGARRGGGEAGGALPGGRAEHERDLRHDHVAGPGDRVLERERALAPAVGVLHDGPAAVQPQDRLVVQLGRARDDPRPERRGRRQELEDRPWLVDGRDDRVDEARRVLGGDRAVVVAVIARVRGGCEDLAGLRVHHHARHALRAIRHPGRV